MMICYFAHSYGEIIRRAPYDDITHFKADSKCVTAFTADSELVLDETLKEIAASHPELVMIHRSTLVRMSDIKSVSHTVGKNHCYIAKTTFGKDLRISRRCYPVIRALVSSREAA